MLSNVDKLKKLTKNWLDIRNQLEELDWKCHDLKKISERIKNKRQDLLNNLTDEELLDYYELS